MSQLSIVDLQYAKSSRPSIPLGFTARRHTGSRAAVGDRIVLVPEIDLARYTFRAVIDWIEVTMEFTNPTQFRYVQDALRCSFPRVCFVKAIDPGPGDTSCKFSFRVQEPRSVATVISACHPLAVKFGKAAEPVVSAIEVSIDAKPKTPSEADRARLLGVMQRTILMPLGILNRKRSRPRYHISKKPVPLFGKSKLKSRILANWLYSTNDRPAPMDSTLSLGALKDPVLIRLMDKVIDRQNPEVDTYEDLDETQKRVRLEVTLREPVLRDLGIREVVDLREFSYVALQGDYFQFKHPTFRDGSGEKSPMLRAVRCKIENWRFQRYLTTGIVGLMVRRHAEGVFRSLHLPELKRQFRRDGKKMRRDRRGNGRADDMVAYKAMNRLVSDALWNLTKREQTAWKKME